MRVKALAHHACGCSSATPSPHWRLSVAVRAALTPGGRLPHPLRAHTRGPAESSDATLAGREGARRGQSRATKFTPSALSAEDALGCLL